MPAGMQRHQTRQPASSCSPGIHAPLSPKPSKRPTPQQRPRGRNPETLQQARAVALGAAPHLAPLINFILPRLPTWLLASNTLHTRHACSGMEPADQAITRQSISFNSANWTNSITLDCDHTEAEQKVADFMQYLFEVDPAAPQPMIVRDPYTACAHITWFLEKPVYTGPQRSETKQLSLPVLRTLRAVRCGLTGPFQADPNFTDRLTKNPFGFGLCQRTSSWQTDKATGREVRAIDPPASEPLWDAHITSGSRLRFHTIPGDCRTITLSTLWAALKRWSADTGLTIPHGQSRAWFDPSRDPEGSRLFNASRRAVYQIGTYDPAKIHELVETQAVRLGSSASARQRRQIVRSISRFMRTKWTGSRSISPGRRRGVMSLVPGTLTLRERQAIGGRYAARQIADATDNRIAAARAELMREGVRPTQSAIAKAAGVSVRTVQRRDEAGRSRPLPTPTGSGYPVLEDLELLTNEMAPHGAERSPEPIKAVSD